MEISHASLGLHLDVSLQELLLPTRMTNYAERQGWSRVRDLVSQHPHSLLTVRNLGRKTLQDTERALHQRIGMAWEDAWSELVGEIDGPARDPMAADITNDRSNPARWVRLASHPDLPRLALQRVDLPTRMRNYVAKHQLTAATELTERSWSSWLREANLGRTSMAVTLEAIETALEHIDQPDPLASAARWRSALEQLIATRDNLEHRILLASRTGLNGPPQTLSQIGEMLRVSRERIRQIEASLTKQLVDRTQTLDWRARLEAATTTPWTPWQQLPAFWEVEDDELEALDFFLQILGSEVRMAVVRGERIATRLNNEQLSELMGRTAQALENLPYPLTLPAVQESIAAVAGGTAESAAVIALFESDLQREGDLVLGFGTRRYDELRAYLRGRGVPVHRSEVEHLMRNFPDDVILIDRGIVTLRELVPEWSVWVERVGKLAVELMQNDPARQWSTFELLPLMADHALFPEWMNPHSLGSLLKDSPHVRYLGRNIVTLEADTSTRTRLLPALVEILQSAGAPLDESQARAQLARERAVGNGAWIGVLRQAPIVALDDQRIGLTPRDVPGGAAAIERFVAELASALSQSGEGWSNVRLREWLDGQGAPYSHWELTLARGLALHSGLFRASRSGGGTLGLAEWSDARAPSQLEVLLGLVEELGGVCPVETATARIPTSTGAPMPRAQLSGLAVRAGLRMRGGFIRGADPSAASASLPAALESWLLALPEEVDEHLRELLGQSSTLDLKVSLERWETELLRDSEGNPYIDPSQVRRLADQARRWLGERFDPALQPMVDAAIRYLLSEEDAQSDRVVGGLDDDEQVFAITREWLDSSRTSA